MCECVFSGCTFIVEVADVVVVCCCYCCWQHTHSLLSLSHDGGLSKLKRLFCLLVRNAKERIEPSRKGPAGRRRKKRMNDEIGGKEFLLLFGLPVQYPLTGSEVIRIIIGTRLGIL